MSLMNSGSAVAMNYALSQDFVEDEVDRKVIFYDMGASKVFS